MKIAQVVSTYPPYKGGMGRVAFEYTERLRERGHKVHVYTPKYKTTEDDPKYVHRLVSPVHFGNAGVMPSLIPRLSGFDIIHLHYPFFGGAEPAIVRKAVRRDQTLVMTYHMDAVADGIKGAIFNMHKRVLFPWIVDRADRIFVSSLDYAKTSALAQVQGSMEKVEVHPFGIDSTKFLPKAQTGLRQRYQIKDSDVLMIFVGGMDPAHRFKGVPELIAALSKLQAKNWKCLMVGGGSLKSSFEALVLEKGLQEQVVFTGGVSNDELVECYQAADLHVFPSTERSEAYGIVALEAAASGIPTIASDLPGVSSVVLDGETGVLVPAKNIDALAEAMEMLIVQVDLRERLGSSARSRVQTEFAWEPLISKLESSYQMLMSTVKDQLL